MRVSRTLEKSTIKQLKQKLQTNSTALTRMHSAVFKMGTFYHVAYLVHQGTHRPSHRHTHARARTTHAQTNVKFKIEIEDNSLKRQFLINLFQPHSKK